jgi:hypothetical protein
LDNPNSEAATDDGKKHRAPVAANKMVVSNGVVTNPYNQDREKGAVTMTTAAAMRDTVGFDATIPIESGFTPTGVLHIPLKLSSPSLRIFIAAVEPS